QGRIVRPPENAGSTDHFRRMDLKTRTLSPEDQAARHEGRAVYLRAVRDWVLAGKHAMTADTARLNLPKVTPEIAQARARFRLGVWFARARPCSRGRRADGGGEPPSSGVVELVATGGRSRPGRQGWRSGVLGARPCVGRSPVLSTTQTVGRRSATRMRAPAGRCKRALVKEIAMELTTRQLRQFAEDGWLFLPGSVSA